MLQAPSVGTPDDIPLEAVARDEEGYFIDTGDWHPGLIGPLAVEVGLELSPERLDIVHYVRSYFERDQRVPEARTVLKHMAHRWGKEKGTRRYLYRLFPGGYAQQACKMAGMRKPLKLMLDI
ncbi:MAG: TusE/DsrC/DsvC family sulfur relay protein [Gammaproteobacteria bacterium]|jgi:tRNA 2-thiouridine synthesizing protein E|nr:TusE/DsrC/DsvC family sulfur relay protein [Gammaproteobacteria bacterium]